MIRARFAPSPTGYLHIGSARTAFFNWLFSKKEGGKFILRIEDTDIARHMEETIEMIFNSLKWMGITWDEGPDVGGPYGPYRQSERTGIYMKKAEELVKSNKAYRCFCSPEILEQKRADAASRNEYFKYDRHCLKLSENEIKKLLDLKTPHVIRLCVPDNTDIMFNDIVYGDIKVSTQAIDDFIIIRSNGLPVYNFSAAVDDILMEITHVIRGEDHLSNTPKQILIYFAMGKDLPVFAHLPMILGSDGQKLSKRHGSISIESYMDEGFLPETIRNYLALLGWSFDEKTTIFTLEELIHKFSLEAINKKPAQFDYEKLLWLNGNYIRNTDDKIIAELLAGRFIKNNDMLTAIKTHGAKITIDSPDINNLYPLMLRIVPFIKERLKTLSDADNLIASFFNEIKYTDELVNYFKDKKNEAAGIIENAILLFEELKDFSALEIEASLRTLPDKFSVNFRRVAEIIRIAVWGSKVSPPLFGAIEIMGRQITLERLKRYKEILEENLDIQDRGQDKVQSEGQ